MAGGGGGSGFSPGLWVVVIEKLLQGEYWTNRYALAHETMAAAMQEALSIVAMERAITGANVLFTRVRVSDPVPNTDVYMVSNVNQFGQLPVTSELLPLFNVVRVDFSTTGGGRPSRKYLRAAIREGDIAFNTISPEMIGLISGNYVEEMLAVPSFRDVDNQTFSSGSVYPFVGMRQLRRGSKRKKTLPDPVEV